MDARTWPLFYKVNGLTPCSIVPDQSFGKAKNILDDEQRIRFFKIEEYLKKIDEKLDALDRRLEALEKKIAPALITVASDDYLSIGSIPKRSSST